MEHKNIAELITPKERNRIKAFKQLSEEEIFIIRKKGQYLSFLRFGMFILLFALFFIKIFYIMLNYSSRVISYFIAWHSITQILIYLSICLLIIYAFIRLVDYYGEQYFDKAKKILSKLNSKEKIK